MVTINPFFRPQHDEFIQRLTSRFRSRLVNIRCSPVPAFLLTPTPRCGLRITDEQPAVFHPCYSRIRQDRAFLPVPFRQAFTFVVRQLPTPIFIVAGIPLSTFYLFANRINDARAHRRVVCRVSPQFSSWHVFIRCLPRATPAGDAYGT